MLFFCVAYAGEFVAILDSHFTGIPGNNSEYFHFPPIYCAYMFIYIYTHILYIYMQGPRIFVVKKLINLNNYSSVAVTFYWLVLLSSSF